MSVYEKINEARTLLQGMTIKRSGKNPFSKYDYFELKDFMPAINRICADIGLCGLISYTDKEATLTIIDTSNPEEKVYITSPMGSASLKGCHDVQNIGAVETYQRRYLWMTALEIVEHDALDAGAEKATYTAEQKAEFDRLMESENAFSFYCFVTYLRAKYGDQVYTDLYNSFEKGDKTKGKAKASKLESAGNDMVTEAVQDIRDAINSSDPAAASLFDELAGYEAAIVKNLLGDDYSKLKAAS